MRYAPTSRLQYSDEVAEPSMVHDFARKMQLIEQYEVDSPEVALKLGTSKKSLANEYKRSQGKLIMMRKLGLLRERKQEEEDLCLKAPEAREALDRLQAIYDEFRATELKSSALEACRGIYRGSALLAAGHSLHEYLSIEMNKLDSEREASYRERNIPFLCQRLAKRLDDVHDPHEAALVQDAVAKLAGTPELDALYEQVVLVIDNSLDHGSLAAVVQGSKLRGFSNGGNLQRALESDDQTILADLLADPFVKIAGCLWETYLTNRDRSKALLSERDALFARLLEFQRLNSDSSEVMYPDCNGSLRLSAGFVEGYSPADAVWAKPHTTLAGLLDKAVEAKLSGDESKMAEFSCPNRLFGMLSSGTDAAASIANVPVCLLYSTDTVGGNSGSPVLNADGELIGINFDRQRHGLMNEFKWSKDYSRSIGTNIRYILWLMGEYDGAKDLVEEMTEIRKDDP